MTIDEGSFAATEEAVSSPGMRGDCGALLELQSAVEKLKLCAARTQEELMFRAASLDSLEEFLDEESEEALTLRCKRREMIGDADWAQAQECAYGRVLDIISSMLAS